MTKQRANQSPCPPVPEEEIELYVAYIKGEVSLTEYCIAKKVNRSGLEVQKDAHRILKAFFFEGKIKQ